MKIPSPLLYASACVPPRSAARAASTVVNDLRKHILECGFWKTIVKSQFDSNLQNHIANYAFPMKNG